MSLQTLFKSNQYLLLIALIIWTIATFSWSILDNISNGFQENIIVFLIYIGCLILHLLIVAVCLYVFRNLLSSNKMRDQEIMYVLKEAFWDNKKFWIFFVPIQVINFILSLLYPNYYLWWFVTLILSLISLQLKKLPTYKSQIFTFFTASIIVAIIIFSIINYQIVGIYYYENLLGNIPLLNYDAVEYIAQDSSELDFKPSIEFVEYFYSSKDWEYYGYPLPYKYEGIEFFAKDIKSIFVFYTYPVFYLFILYLSSGILANSIKHYLLSLQ